MQVIRNRSKTIAECLNLRPQAIVIGPGPGNPKGAGISLPLIQAAADSVPLLGICLGHQAIAEAFGGQVIRAHTPIHGKTSPIHHHNTGIFSNIPSPFKGVRYHSLIVNPLCLPNSLEATAYSLDPYQIMAIRHRTLPIEGVQFHPESVASEHGLKIMQNFLDIAIQK